MFKESTNFSKVFLIYLNRSETSPIDSIVKRQKPCNPKKWFYKVCVHIRQWYLELLFAGTLLTSALINPVGRNRGNLNQTNLVAILEKQFKFEMKRGTNLLNLKLCAAF